MTNESWSALDRAAEQEAQALIKARKHRSVFQNKMKGKVISREQASYDEGLTEHAHTCYYCGRSLQAEIPTQDRTINNEWIDVCNPCAFLHDLTRRVEASREKKQNYGRKNRAAVCV